jgi:two-component system sensor histidine kinase CpxA
MLSSIFKPFFRVDSGRDSASGGVGLGLAIAQSAIALHGGKLSATNMHPGLLVRIELPEGIKVPAEENIGVNVS